MYCIYVLRIYYDYKMRIDFLITSEIVVYIHALLFMFPSKKYVCKLAKHVCTEYYNNISVLHLALSCHRHEEKLSNPRQHLISTR